MLYSMTGFGKSIVSDGEKKIVSPDGIKRKSPGVDEPWHFIDPSDPSDTALVEMIMDHYANLVQALKKRNNVRAAFEAAWMAHAITDGLTPAHHYPLGEKIEELWGRPQNERASIAEKDRFEI